MCRSSCILPRGLATSSRPDRPALARDTASRPVAACDDGGMRDIEMPLLDELDLIVVMDNETDTLSSIESGRAK